MMTGERVAKEAEAKKQRSEEVRKRRITEFGGWGGT
jgi:hypothetical protein